MKSRYIGVAVAIGFGTNVMAMGPDVVKASVVKQPTGTKLNRLIKKIANQEITRRARGLRVGRADVAERADRANAAVTASVSNSSTTATTALNADTARNARTADTAGTALNAGVAESALSAEPARYARVNSNGTIDLANSKGFSDANVVVPQDGEGNIRGGLYCFNGVPGLRGAIVAAETPPEVFDAEGNQISPNTTSATFTMGTAGTNAAGPGCPNGTQFGVEITGQFPSGSSGPADSSFYMLLYR